MVVIVLFSFFYGGTFAQCYGSLNDLGEAAFGKGKYDEAIGLWNDAMECSDCDGNCRTIINRRIDEANKRKREAANLAAAKKQREYEARQRAQKQKEEDDLWETAQSEDDLTKYQNYIDQYPDGRYVAAAHQKIRELEDAKKNSVPDGTAGSVVLAGKTYRTVRLAGLTWMTQNLDYEVAGSWCYKNDPANCRKYGRLYTWEASVKVCASLGWRLPTDEEWQALAKQFGGYFDDLTQKDIGDWAKANRDLLVGGKSGFSAVLGGHSDTVGGFYYLGDIGLYWSATEYDRDNAWHYGFGAKLYRFLYGSKGRGFSCRCVQD